MRITLLALLVFFATLNDPRSARAEERDLRASAFGDVLVRNGDIISASIVAWWDAAWLPAPGAMLAIDFRPRVGLGGASAALGVLGYFDCGPYARHLPCAGLNFQAVVLRSWWLSNWHTETYAGGEVGLEYYFIRLTLGAFKGLESNQTRLQIGIGLGV